MQKLKVMHVITYLPVGGVERLMISILSALNKERFEPLVVCTKERGRLAPEMEAAGVPVHLCRLSTRLGPWGLCRLARLMRQEKVDLVHTHMYASNVSGTLAARLAGIPVVVGHIHGLDKWKNRRQLWVNRLVSRWQDRVICVSNRVRENYIRATGVNSGKVITIYNGIEAEKFKGPFDRESKRKELGLEPGDKALGMVARLIPVKAPEDLLSAAPSILAAIPRAKFLFIGGGDLEDSLRQKARELGLEQKIKFLGSRSDIPEILAALDLFVLTSIKEGFCLALAESMAAGLPVVSADGGGSAEVVAHGQTGLVVPPRDPAALALAVIKILKDEELAKTMGREGCRRVEELFSLGRLVKELEELYLQLWEQNAKRKGEG
jgi:glycosyltransferase involved in cell wall biosynthesis